MCVSVQMVLSKQFIADAEKSVEDARLMVRCLCVIGTDSDYEAVLFLEFLEFLIFSFASAIG